MVIIATESFTTNKNPKHAKFNILKMCKDVLQNQQAGGRWSKAVCKKEKRISAVENDGK